jgi:natural product biosynthesis luciferase-like monooxygenase protein
MLFHHLSSERPGVDLEQIVCRLEECVDAEALLAAWKRVVGRHDALRTSFRWADLDEPVQVVHPSVEVSFDVFGEPASDEAARRARLDRYLEEDRRRGFDFSRPPLLRLALFPARDGGADLVWTFPHILLDGRSFPIVLGEAFDAYDAALDGRDVALPDPVPYREHVAWIQAQDWSAAEAFWRARLGGFSAATPLPAAGPGRPEPQGRGERETRLSRETSDALRALAERRQVTLNTVLQGAWALLLSRHANERHVVFGATRACRSTGIARAREAVGLFINTLPVRVDVDPEARLGAWLTDLRLREREVRDHEHTPLLDLQTWSAVPPGRPLFESILVYDGWLLGPHMQARGGAYARRSFVLHEQASYPLVLYGYGEPEVLLKLAYDRPLYDDETASRLLDRLATLLRAMAEDPERRIGSLPVLAPEERRRTLEEWNATGAPVPEATVPERIVAQASRTPDATAVVFEDERVTYRELDVRSNRLARRLRALGVGPDVLVGLCVERSVEMMVALLAIHKAGGAYLPLAPEYPADRIAYMLRDAAAPLVLTEDALVGRLGHHGAQVLRLDAEAAAIAREPEAPVPAVARPENLAYVIYTSGSTGRPKGVMVEHRQVASFFAAMDAAIPGAEPGRAWLAVTSLSFDISVLELLWPLTRGLTVVVHADQARVAHRLQAETARAPSPVSFSLMYFASGEGAGADTYRLLLEGARFADEHGFEAVWTPERHFHAFGGLYPNPSVTAAALAGVTRRVALRAGSVVLPNHHPVRVAEEWSFVDNLSGGRVGISAASGWQPNDFVFCPQNYADAKEVMFRHLDVVRRLWRGEELRFPGPRGDVALRTLPRPIQKELPVWLTAAGNPETFRRAGEIGANVLTHMLGQTVGDLADRIRVYREAWRAAGHPGVGRVTLMLHTFVGDDVEDVRETVRRPMKDYLLSSVGLIRGFVGAWTAFKRRADGGGGAGDVDLSSLTPEEMEGLADFSFERYFETSALFGTPESCLPFVRRLVELGIDEIACLVDFGVETERALRHLVHLDRLRRLAATLAPATPASAPEGARADHGIAAQIASHRVTHLQCTPSMARMLLLDPETRRALGQLRTLLVGGEAFPGHLADELRGATSADLLNMYGPTETTIWSSTHRVEAGGEATVPIGRPIANTSLYVLGEGGEPVPPGVPGELHVGGQGVARGYLERPDLTAQRFVPDPFSRVPGARMYRTGDLARYREDGVVEFLGRTDHQVKVRGHRIELGEIESLLAEEGSLRAVVVVAREDVVGDQRLVAYGIPHAGRTLDATALQAHLRARLPEWMVPTHFVALSAFPETPNRKVDRKALPAPVEAPAARQGPYRAPESDVEGRVAAVWRDVLRLAQVGRDDNFFDLGGHSLLAVKAHRALVAEFGPGLRILDLFRYPTLRSLAAHLAGAPAAPAPDRGEERASVRRDAMSRRRAARAGARGEATEGEPR